jgi:isocitrate dehydrogenase
VVQCLKLISRPGTERIVRYAFEYARRHGLTKVACFTKDNIMKLTDGLFHQVFDEIATQYPDIESEHLIVDIGAARLADTPEAFDVLVVPNLYGDILSDVAAQLAGSVGLAASANVGTEVSMFEAIHGSAPLLAGQDVANPSGLMLAAVQMLVHIGQGDVATKIHNAWLAAIEDGVHTFDIYDPKRSTQKVGTTAFAEAVVARLGQSPKTLRAAAYPDALPPICVTPTARTRPVKAQVGIDVFVDWTGSVEQLGSILEQAAGPDLRLVMVTNRGQKVYPDGLPETFCVDHWRCRFQPHGLNAPLTTATVIDLLGRLDRAGLPFIKTEGLYNFDGVPGYSLGQGQ